MFLVCLQSTLPVAAAPPSQLVQWYSFLRDKWWYVYRLDPYSLALAPLAPLGPGSPSLGKG